MRIYWSTPFVYLVALVAVGITLVPVLYIVVRVIRHDPDPSTRTRSAGRIRSAQG